MDNAFVSSTSVDLHDSSRAGVSGEHLSHVFHALANKLLPITVFSELALRHCEDPRVMRELEKIHRAAEEARDLIVRVRQDWQPELSESKSVFSISPKGS